MSNGDAAAQVTVTELHERTGATLRDVRREGRTVEVVDRYGDPLVAIVPLGHVRPGQEAANV